MSQHLFEVAIQQFENADFDGHVISGVSPTPRQRSLARFDLIMRSLELADARAHVVLTFVCVLHQQLFAIVVFASCAYMAASVLTRSPACLLSICLSTASITYSCCVCVCVCVCVVV